MREMNELILVLIQSSLEVVPTPRSIFQLGNARSCRNLDVIMSDLALNVLLPSVLSALLLPSTLPTCCYILQPYSDGLIVAFVIWLVCPILTPHRFYQL